ncbi:hypothetical protein SLEP1_g16922 [Rubroshorea leprosula]|uniref:Uncharacterized protein n=1 Tax=Rubroshorea leprosula TaxID=152421 RepID=A0AAV5J1B9_9ROSI|nr:hypothetical protein SLEP1_g16922 [Rubroshorea leprosula]
MLLTFVRAMQALPSGKVNTYPTDLFMLLKSFILKIGAA